jgi:hypothetical protein
MLSHSSVRHVFLGAALGIAQEGVYKTYRFDVRTLCDRNKIATGAVSLLHLLCQAP